MRILCLRTQRKWGPQISGHALPDASPPGTRLGVSGLADADGHEAGVVTNNAAKHVPCSGLACCKRDSTVTLRPSRLALGCV